MADVFTPYETGLTRLLKRLGSDHPRYADALVYQQRLLENITQARQYGDTDTLKHERAQIVGVLNQLALGTVGVSFNELYLSSLESTQTAQWEPTADLTQTANKQSKMLAERIGRLESILIAGLTLTPEQAELANRLTMIAVPRPDSVPLRPVVYAPREDLVRELCQNLAGVTWLALVEGPGKGKTQLARSIAEACGVKHTWWVSLRGLEGTIARLRLEQQIALWLVQLKADEHLRDLYARGLISVTHLAELVSESVGKDGLLVVDNLPDSLEDELLLHDLSSLAIIFTSHGTKLVTTGQRSLPPILQTDLGVALSIIKPPLFSRNDVLEMLQSAEAPNEIRKDGVISLILGSTEGHPSLVAASVYWLRQHEWRLKEEEWFALLLGDPTEDVREHERRRMLRLLNDRLREFLYRLSLLRAEFDGTLALKIAAVSPPIEHPGECLDELAGPWLDRLKGGQYEVTPLLRGAGQHNLSEDAQKQVHRAAADHYLSQSVIDASQALLVALHLWGAGDHHGFALILIQLMVSAATPSQAKQIEWATWVISPDMEWPTEIGLDLRIMLRAAQVRTRVLAGSDATKLDADLEQLMAEAGPDNSLALLFAYTNTALLNEIPAVIAMQRAIQAVRLLRENQLVPEEDFPGKFEEVVWFPVVRLEGADQIHQFLVELRQMMDEERKRLFVADLAVETTSHLIDRIWMIEADRPTGQQDWDSVLEFLDEVEEVGSLPGANPLHLAQVRARAVVLADYLEQSEAALSVLDAVSEPTEPDLLFLLRYTAGCILFDTGHFADALSRFDAAAVSDGEAFLYYRFDAKRRAAIAQSKLGEWEDAKTRCIGIIHLSTEMEEFLTYDRLEMMGELAWIHWATGNRKKACAAMYGLVTGLVEREEVTEPRFREAFNKAGHALGWLSSIAATGQPLSITITGEPYHPVEAGLFGIRRDRLGGYVPPVGFSKALLLIKLGILAGALDLSRMAWKIHKSVGSFVQEGEIEAFLEYRKVELSSLAARFGYPNEAIELGLQAVKVLAIGRKLREGNIDVLSQTINLRDAWESISDEERKTTERHLLYLVLGPALTDLLGADLSEDEVERRLVTWKRALCMQREAFDDPDFWEQVAQFLEKLEAAWIGKPLPEEELDILEEEPLLKVLWDLACSSHQDTRLVDSLRMQVIAVEFLARPAGFSEKHMLPGTGRFVHRFWLNVADTRGFALNSPQLFRTELLGISPRQGVKTAVEVLRSASRAIGVSLPERILTRFKQVEKSEV